MTKRFILEREALTGGLNDTPFPSNRHLSQAKEFKHIRPQKDFSLEKIKGRKNVANISDIKSITKIPVEKPLVEITSTTNQLYFKYGANYYTASISPGKYYLYSELASALQTAMNTAIGAGGDIQVEFDYNNIYGVGAYRFWIWSDTQDIIVYWKHSSNTTIDPTIFGFRYSESGPAGSGIYSHWQLDYEPPNNILVFTDSKLQDENGNELTYWNGDSLKSSEKWTSIWHNNRLYASDGENFIISEDNKYIKDNIEDCPIDVSFSGPPVDQYDYNQTDDTNDSHYITLDSDHPEAWFPNIPVAGLINKITIRLRKQSGNFVLKIYVVHHRHRYQTLIKSISGTEISSVAFLDYTYNIYNCFSFNGGILLKLEGSGSLQVRINANAQYGYKILNQVNGLWTSYTGYNLYGRIWKEKFNGVGAEWYGWRYKITVSNKYGVESSYVEGRAGADREGTPYICISWSLSIPDNADFDYINLYRTLVDTSDYPDEDSTYYKVFSIPRYIWEDNIGSSFSFSESVQNSLLQQQAEYDTFYTHNNLKFKYSCWWQERHWVAGVSDSEDVVYWSKANTPESFDLSTNWIKIGVDGSPITGLIPLGNRLLVFKENSIFIIYPSGTAFGLTDLKQKGIGTRSHWSLVSAFTNEGSAVFFQGQDGHFYATDGIKLTNISAGRLDETINSLNLNALDQTYAIYDDYNHEIIWSVCTDSNTSPDLNIVYNLDKNSFHTETMPANIWTKYTDKDTGKIIILGASSDKIFERENDNADLDNDISMVWETADYDCGEPETEKSFIALYIYAYGENSNQELSISWYIDESSSAEGTHTLDLTTSATEHRIPISGRGKKIRFKFTNTDQLGKVKIGRLVIEYQPIGVIKR